jgi:hypothetical protein
MHLPAHLTSRTRPRRYLAAAATLLAPLLVSCASPGPPRPPSLHLPDVVTDLAAQRVGDRVLLHWTSPSRTTDGFTAPSPLTAEICRETNPTSQPATKKSSSAPDCLTVLYIAVVPGPSDAADLLPAQFTADPVLPLAYRIRILNPDRHSAGFSRPAIAAAGATPPPVAGLRALTSRTGILLEWQPSAEPSFVELRRDLAPDSPPKPEVSKLKPGMQKRPLIDCAGCDSSTTTTLRAAGDHLSPTPSDPGGTLDRSAQRGQIYTYRAQRIRNVALAGHTFELRSEPSSPVTVNLTDTFPPAIPTGLAAIPGSTATAPSIDLSWQPGTESDLAGYNVYRAATHGAFQRLTAMPVLGPAFSDTTVTPGTAYTYRVTAIDNSGNESAPSAEITETARTPQNL